VITADLKTVAQLLRGQPRSGSHAERLQAFYAPQAASYDRFRERLLLGRAELVRDLDPPEDGHVAELGCGTGRNLLYFGERLARFSRVDLVDLCPALLEQARARYADRDNVYISEADATGWRSPVPLDAVYFAYSLTMIPDWRSAIDNAIDQLKPGGLLGVVDFYVSERQPPAGLRRHGLVTRRFWPPWFRHDGVQLDARRLDHLRLGLPDHRLIESFAPIPYLPGLKVPYFRFIGRRQ
jgi:S-adenosylmethionine-diacylgycerolhomoserine-N-methlytransferase